MQPLPQPHDHLLLAALHIDDFIKSIKIDEAFSAAAFEARITAYGYACAQRALLLRIQADLHTLIRSDTASSLVDPERGNRPVPGHD